MKTIKDFGVDYKERVEKAISYLQAGKGILLVDDENRENEGDIIYSAEKMTVKDMTPVSYTHLTLPTNSLV